MKRLQNVFFIMLVAALLLVGSTAAFAIDQSWYDLAKKVVAVYNQMDDDDKEKIEDAKESAEKGLDESEWDDVLGHIDPVIEATETQNNRKITKDQAMTFIEGASQVAFNTDVADLASNLIDFYDNPAQKAVVTELFPSCSLQNFITLYSDWFSYLDDAVSHYNTNGIPVSNIASEDNNTIRGYMQTWSTYALTMALEEDHNNNVDGDRVALGLSAQDVVDALTEYSKLVDESRESEIALAKAFIRSLVEEISGDTLLTVGKSTTFGVQISDYDCAEYVNWISTNTAVADFNGDNSTLTAKKTGVTYVMAYKDNPSFPGGDYIYKVMVTVISAPQEALNEAKEIINDPDATDSQMADAVDNAATILNDYAATIEDVEQAEEVVEIADEVIEILNLATSKIEDAAAFSKLGYAANQVLSALVKAAGVITTVGMVENQKITSQMIDTDAHLLEKRIQEIGVQALDTIINLLEKMDADDVEKVAEQTATLATSLAQKLQGEAAEYINNKAKEVADKAAEIMDGNVSPGGGGGGGGTPSSTTEPEEALNEAKEIIKDPDATDSQMAYAVYSAAKCLNDYASTIEEVEQAEEVVKIADKALEVLNLAAGKIQDASAFARLGNAANQVMNALVKAADMITAKEGKKEIRDIAGQTLDAIKSLIINMDASNGSQVAQQTVQLAGSLAQELQGEAVAYIAGKALKVAKNAVEKAGTYSISDNEISITDNKTIVEPNLTALQKNAKLTAQAASKMMEILKENGFVASKALLAVITIEVPEAGKEQVETKLPAGTLNVLADKGINKLEIKTEVASFGIAPTTFGKGVMDKDVVLQATKVNSKDIPQAAKRHVPAGSNVVDLNASVGGSQVSSFNLPIVVSIPYAPADGEKPDEITVFLLQDDGKVVPVGGKYDSVTGSVNFATAHFSKYFAKTARNTFSDLSNWGWAEESIEILAGKGIIAGRTDTTFDPGADVTRAEFSALVVRMLSLNTDDNQDLLPFKDVPIDAWYRKVVATAYANGIVGGKAVDKFDPNGKITMQEMAVIISRIVQANGYLYSSNLNDLDRFADKDQIADWARSGTALVAREGIVDGLNDGKIAPTKKANRAQTAVMLHRLFNKIY